MTRQILELTLVVTEGMLNADAAARELAVEIPLFYSKLIAYERCTNSEGAVVCWITV
jgi:hypothetical protein